MDIIDTETASFVQWYLAHFPCISYFVSSPYALDVIHTIVGLFLFFGGLRVSRVRFFISGDNLPHGNEVGGVAHDVMVCISSTSAFYHAVKTGNKFFYSKREFSFPFVNVFLTIFVVMLYKSHITTTSRFLTSTGCNGSFL